MSSSLCVSFPPGKTIGEKAIVVRLHEPKRVRAEKLAEQRAKGLAGLGGMRGPMSPLARYGDLPEPGLYGEGFGHDRRRSSGSASGGGGGGGSYQSTVRHAVQASLRLNLRARR